MSEEEEDPGPMSKVFTLLVGSILVSCSALPLVEPAVDWVILLK